MAQTIQRQIIVGAHRLISKPQTWCRQCTAKDRHGLPVAVISDEAVRFCAWGALLRIAFELEGEFFYEEPAMRAHRALSAELTDINDQQGRKAVLEVLDAWLAANPV